MADRTKTSQHISIRVPLRELSVVDTYAAAHGTSRAQAVLHFVRAGIAAETGERPATKSDLVALAATIEKAIKDQPIAVQQAAPATALSEAESAEGVREAERERIAGMGWRERRRYLRG